MEAKDILLKAKDIVAEVHGYELFRKETGGWTRFDKLWDESTENYRKKLLDQVAYQVMLIGIEIGIKKGVTILSDDKKSREYF